MTDALAESGKTIDYAKLKEKLKILVPISALEEKGLDNLISNKMKRIRNVKLIVLLLIKN